MQATTRLTRWRARRWRTGTPQRRRRTLTYREVWRRARVPGVYPRSPRGVGRVFRDLVRATAHPLLVDAMVAAPFMVPARFTDREAIVEDAQRLRG